MAQEAEVEVPVLIVGGGVAGLTASMLLSNLGIPSLLVSRYPHTSQLPKAHILNQRFGLIAGQHQGLVLKRPRGFVAAPRGCGSRDR